MPLRGLAATLLLLAAAHLAGAAAPSEPIVNFRDMPVHTRGKAPSASQVREVIITAGQQIFTVGGSTWHIVESEPGRALGRIQWSRHAAEVDIAYSPERFSVVYRGSSNLGYEEEGQLIHPTYNRLVRGLVYRIQTMLAALDGDPTRVVAARDARTTAAQAPASPSRREESLAVAVNVTASAGTRRSRAWPALVAEWQNHFPAAAEQAGASLVTVRESEPSAMARPGTLVAVQVNYFRFLTLARRHARPGAHTVNPASGSLDVSVRFFDLMSGDPIGTERKYTVSGQAEDEFVQTTNLQVRNMAHQIMRDWRDLIATAPRTDSPAPSASAPPAKGPSRSGADHAEVSFWETVRDSDNPAELQAYLDTYPSGIFVPLARVRLAAVRAAAPRPASVPVVPSDPAPVAAARPAARQGPPQAGDSWTYRLSYPKRWGDLPRKNPTRLYVATVESVSDASIVDKVTIDGGEAATATHRKGSYLLSQGVSVYSPYLEVGESGPGAAQLAKVEVLDPPCNAAYHCQANARLDGTQVVTVPAGTFTARRIVIEESWRPGAVIGHPNQTAQMNGGRVLTVWYAPELRRAIKYQSRSKTGDIPPVEANFDLELVGYQLK